MIFLLCIKIEKKSNINESKKNMFLYCQMSLGELLFKFKIICSKNRFFFRFLYKEKLKESIWKMNLTTDDSKVYLSS